MRRVTNKDQNKEQSLKQQILKEYTKLFIHGLTFVSALGWNSAFQKTFEEMNSLSLIGPWLYAVVISLVCVGITVCFKKFLVE